MGEKSKEWVITSTTDKDPESLEEIAILTEDEEHTLDKLIGKNFLVEIREGLEHFDPVIQKIVVRSLDNILALFHEIGHGVVADDPVIKKIVNKVEGGVRVGKRLEDFDLEEINELVLIRAERMASAYALKKIREIKQRKGINLLEEKSAAEIKNTVESAIRSHFINIKNTREYQEKLEKLLKELFKNKKK